MIRKTVLLGVVVLLALIVAAPAAIGLYIARQFDQIVAQLDQPGFTRVASSRFSRGWFSSHAVIRLRLADRFCREPPCPAVTLDSRIYHGPIPFATPRRDNDGLTPTLAIAVTHLDVAALWPRLVFNPVLAPLRLVSRTGFDRVTRLRLALPGTVFAVARQQPLARVTSRAGALRAAMAPDGRLRSLAVDWPAFSLAPRSGGQLGWRRLRLRFADGTAATTGSHGLSVHVAALTFDNGQGDSTRLQNLVFAVLPAPTVGNGSAARFSLSAAGVVLPSTSDGPLVVQGRVMNIDTAAWAGLPAAWLHWHDGGDGPDDIQLYQEILPALLDGGARLDIAPLRLDTADGPLTAHLHLSAPPRLQPATLAADLVSQLDVDFALRVPTPLLRRMVASHNADYGPFTEDRQSAIDRAIDDLKNRHLIEAVPGKSAYRTRLRIANGKLTLNGRVEPGWQSVIDQFQAVRHGIVPATAGYNAQLRSTPESAGQR